jgi:hypothetical protein
MQPNTLSIHYTIRDNDENRLLDQSKVVVPKKRGYLRIVAIFRKIVLNAFTGGKHE